MDLDPSSQAIAVSLTILWLCMWVALMESLKRERPLQRIIAQMTALIDGYIQLAYRDLRVDKRQVPPPMNFAEVKPPLSLEKIPICDSV